MLFNSYIFLFLFIPVVIAGFQLLGKLKSQNISILWLIISSLLFYGWWNYSYLFLLLFSIVINYILGSILSGAFTSRQTKNRRYILIFGLMVNIFLLGYFKYANFFVDNINYLLDTFLTMEKVILPLAISFFTFQQITYLIDTYNKKIEEHSFLHYCLFVSFFPQLIAGPIVHHKEMMPQFMNKVLYKLRHENVVIGISIFSIGLFKKVVFADSISIYVASIFDAASSGVQLTFFEAWLGAILYGFQLYFDFSGYSDMAIGLARIFGITLPINFYSPFKSKNIADFWRSWHITLSNFIKSYLFYPFSIKMARYAIVNSLKPVLNFIYTIVLPMTFAWFIAGLWHGAGWTFVIFGLMHGFYLIFFQIWLIIKRKWLLKVSIFPLLFANISRVVTYVFVIISFVIFRSDDLNSSLSMYRSMFGFNGVSIPFVFEGYMGIGLTELLNIRFDGMFYNGLIEGGDLPYIILVIFIFFIITYFLPNSIQIFENYNPVLEFEKIGDRVKSSFHYNKERVFDNVIIGLIFAIGVMFIQGESEFLYFQF